MVGQEWKLEVLSYNNGGWWEVVSYEPDDEGRLQPTHTQHERKLYASEYFKKKLDELIRRHGL